MVRNHKCKEIKGQDDNKLTGRVGFKVGLFEGEDVTGGSVGLGVTTSGSEGLIDGDFDGDTEGLSDG